MDVRQTCFWSEKAASRLRLCELPGTEHPLARLQRFGPGALSTAELIELIVGASEALGRDVVSRFEDLEGLARAGLAEVAALKGVGIARAARIQAAFELGRRLAFAPLLGLAPQIRSPADAANLLISTMSLLEQETLRTLVLDTRNRLVADVLVYQGNVSGSMVRVAEVYREAIRRNAPSILVAHNHRAQRSTMLYHL